MLKKGRSRAFRGVVWGHGGTGGGATPCVVLGGPGVMGGAAALCPSVSTSYFARPCGGLRTIAELGGLQTPLEALSRPHTNLETDSPLIPGPSPVPSYVGRAVPEHGRERAAARDEIEAKVGC